MVSRVAITESGADGGEGRTNMGSTFYRVECVKENVVKVNRKVVKHNFTVKIVQRFPLLFS